jgi:hypothetical protein
MASAIKSIVFVLVICGLLAFAAGTWVSLAAVIVSLTILAGMLIYLAIHYPVVATSLGWMGWEVGEDSRKRLWIMLILTAITFVTAINFGAGEPVFITTWRETMKLVQLNDEQQQTKNVILHGLVQTNNTVEFDIGRLKAAGLYNGRFYRPRPEQSGESMDEFNQSIRNWKVYKVFTSDRMLRKLIADAPMPNTVERKDKISFKTWYFWKLTGLLAFFTFLYLPFAYAHSAANILEQIGEALERKRGELRAAAIPTPIPVVAGVAPVAAAIATPAAPSIKLPRFLWFLGNELASETIVKFIGEAVKYLRK